MVFFRIFFFELKKRKTIASIIIQTEQKSFYNTNDSKKLIEYLASVAIAVLSKACVGAFTTSSIYIFSFTMHTDELISTPKVTFFLNELPPHHENCKLALNPISKHLYPPCLSGSAFLVSLVS